MDDLPVAVGCQDGLRQHRGELRPAHDQAIPSTTAQPDAPRILFMHGGGWISGGIDTLDHLCTNLSRSAQCLIVSVDYRLAPETPLPGALEDCHDALKWLASDSSLGAMPSGRRRRNGRERGRKPAAALCVLNVRRGGPPISHQTLIYPCVDATLESPSMAEGPPGFQKKDIAALDRTVPGHRAAHRPPVVAAVRRESCRAASGADHYGRLDPARDDGARYARKLSDAGVRVRYLNYDGTPHAFFFMPRICRAANEALAEISAEISALGSNEHQ